MAQIGLSGGNSLGVIASGTVIHPNPKPCAMRWGNAMLPTPIDKPAPVVKPVQMIHVNFTDLRNRLAHWFDRTHHDSTPILVTRQGHEPVVMMAQSDYDSIMETLYLKSNPVNAARLDASIARLNAGESLEKSLADL
jgi:antitoxin YefM